MGVMMSIYMRMLRLGTRSAFWFAVGFGALFLVRVPFLFVHYVPYHLPFEPWVALVPLVGVLWGPPGILAVGVATALGDWMAGLRDALPLWHAVGFMGWAWSARALWVIRPPVEAREDADPEVTWSASLYFVVVSLPGAFVAAVCMGLGADLLRSYAFPYVAVITLCNHLVYLAVLGVFLYRVFQRALVSRFGCWDESHTPRRPSMLGAALQVVGAAGAWLIGMAVAIRMGYPARGPVVYGDTAGLRLLPGVLPFLLLFVIGLVCPPVKRRETGSMSSGTV